MNRRLPILLAALTPFASAQSPFLDPVQVTLTMDDAEVFVSDDFSGDGIADLIIGGDELFFIRSLGPAGFDRYVRIGNPDLEVLAIASGDLSGDGHQDVLTVETPVNGPFNAPYVLVSYENDGTGTFTRRVLLPMGPESQRIQLTDMDGDGDADFVLERRSTVEVIWYENVQGAASGAARLIAPAVTRYWRAQDANQDGLTDLIFEGEGLFTVTVVLATAPGVFGVPQPLFAGLGASNGIRLRDVNADGLLDGVLSSQAGISIAYAAAPLSFQAFTALSVVAPSDQATLRFIQDLNGDGLVDICYTDLNPPSTGRSRWLAGQAGGGFAAPQEVIPPTQSLSINLMHDVTGDGLADGLLLTSSGLIGYPNQHGQGGTLLGSSAFGVFFQAHNLNDITVLDVDLDGDLDTVGLRRDNTTIAIYENDGTGSLTERGLIPFTGARAESLAAHDFDLDGDDDLVIVSGAAGVDQLSILRNDGGGAFQQVLVFSPPMAGIGEMQVADIDGDGDLDIAIPSGGGASALRWLKNEGVNLSFTEFVIGMPVGTTLGDVDDDGRPDFVCTRPQGGAHIVSWRRNQGGGTFAPETTLMNALNSSFVSLSDVNGDGKTDVILNQGNPIFVANATTPGSQYGPLTALGISFAVPNQRLQSLDLNADGRPDLVGSRDSSFARVWLNPGPGPAVAPVAIFKAVGIQTRPHFRDLDGDGDLDAIAVHGQEIWTASNGTSRPVGINICGPANSTSIGIPARMAADGSLDLADMDVTLIAEDMPANVTGIFLVSRTVGAPQPLVGSQGTLCLMGAVGRFTLPMEIQNSGAGGTMRLQLDVNFIPQGNGRIPLMAGETWHFQGWFRDTVLPVGATSNLTDAISLTF